jgi:lysocardiolipin and lysophospholipid acyltransferase
VSNLCSSLIFSNRSSRGKFGQDYYTLRSMYLRGQPPPSVNMYWRRFAMKDIPLENQEVFDLWLREKWYEKDAIMEEYMTNGRFPASTEAIDGAGDANDGYIETEVKLAHWWEVGNIFVVLAAFALVFNLLARVWTLVVYGKQ